MVTCCNKFIEKDSPIYYKIVYDKNAGWKFMAEGLGLQIRCTTNNKMINFLCLNCAVKAGVHW